MKNARYEHGKAKLLALLDDLFGKPLSNDEFNFRLGVLGEQECWIMADGYLTQSEILEIEESWTRPTPAVA